MVRTGSCAIAGALINGARAASSFSRWAITLVASPTCHHLQSCEQLCQAWWTCAVGGRVDGCCGDSSIVVTAFWVPYASWPRGEPSVLSTIGGRGEGITFACDLSYIRCYNNVVCTMYVSAHDVRRGNVHLHVHVVYVCKRAESAVRVRPLYSCNLYCTGISRLWIMVYALSMRCRVCKIQNSTSCVGASNTAPDSLRPDHHPSGDLTTPQSLRALTEH